MNRTASLHLAITTILPDYYDKVINHILKQISYYYNIDKDSILQENEIKVIKTNDKYQLVSNETFKINNMNIYTYQHKIANGYFQNIFKELIEIWYYDISLKNNKMLSDIIYNEMMKDKKQQESTYIKMFNN